MKNTGNLCFITAVLFTLFSCQSEQEKLIQTKMDEIKGQWKISSFESSSSAPNQLKGLIKSGIFVFKNCKAKNVIEERARCGADVELNGDIYSLSYRFDTNFTFSLTPVKTDGTGRVIYTPNDFLLKSLMDGNWEIVVKDNSMIGKQITPSTPNILSTFSATRQ